MHQSPKPVRKCHGCKLNLADHCAVFPDPHEQWKRGVCKGFNNEALCRKYLDEQFKHPPDPGKEKRRERAKLAHTEPHHTGTMVHTTPFVDRRRKP